jgi:hypothetical protein
VILEDLETVMRAGAAEVAQATPLRSPGAVRARGNSYRRRRLAAGTVTGLVVVAALATGAVAATSLPVRSHAAAAGAAGAVPTGSVKVQLAGPAIWTYAASNLVQLTISSTTGAHTVLAKVNLGKGPATVPPSVQWLAPGTSTWQNVRVRHQAAGWIAALKLHISAGSTTEQLSIVPPWNGNVAPFGSQALSAAVYTNGRLVAYRQVPAAPLKWASATVSVSPAASGGAFTIKARNLTPTAIPGAYLAISTYLCSSTGTACHSLWKHERWNLPAGDEIEQLRGSSWKPVSLITPLPEGALPGSGTRQFKLRLVTGTPAAGTIQLQISVTNGGNDTPLTFFDLRPVTLPLS